MISACPSIRADYHQGNIYENDFMEVWNHRFKPYRDREWMKKDECADCRPASEESIAHFSLIIT